jgi:hypothetical protein
MKRTSWVVSFRRYGGFSDIEYACTYAYSAQEAVDWARYELNVYEVVECFKKVSNWS